MFTPPIASLSVSSDSETEEDELGINLARFAYQGGSRPPAAPQIKPGLITVARIEDTRDPTLNKKSIRRTGPHSTTDFSDIAIAKLTTCISCNLKWTARKSAVEKMKHVKSCAKKNSLADETVRVLIRQEIDKAPVNAKEKGKGKLVHLEPPKEPNTVLEDVINDRGPKKRGKRPAVTKTVKSLTETRDVILDRARTILGNADDVDSSIQTQAFGPSKLIGGLPRSEMARIPPTQPFGQSALRQAQKDIRPNPILALAPMSDRVGVVSDSEHSDDSDVKKILPTQKFAPSKLGEPRAHPVSSGSGVIDSGLPSALAMSPEPGVLTIASPSQGSGSSLVRQIFLQLSQRRD
jgi:hypothetical protein